MILLEMLIVVGLVLLNGVLAMSELAVVSARPVRLRQLAESGHGGARRALELQEEPTAFLSTVQVGITLVGVLNGAYSGATLAEPLAAALAGLPLVGGSAYGVALALVVTAVTYLSLIAGELVPKRIALDHAETIAARVARPMTLVARVGAPLVWVLQRSTEAVLRLLGVRPQAGGKVSEEEVRALIAEGTRTGVFEPAERAMIEAVLHIADRRVRSIMTSRTEVVWLDPDDAPETIRAELAESGHSRFPVARGNLENLLGIVQTKDIVAQLNQSGRLDLLACLKQPLILPESTPVLRAMELFRGTPVHMAVVLDEYGSIEGIVTPTDFLEAIVGILPEAGTEDVPEATRREDGSWLIDGRLALHHVERALGVGGMSQGHDYTTMAGFVLWRLGRLPRASDHFTWRGLRFEVVDMDGRRVDKVMVSELPAEG